ncbi:cobalamin biosynthesis protein [Gymnodinialimonas ceratoperidinii]|uniref:Cobalamin biosynthesis protein n=1 Tax=Gymnodinialimonas ceratoperidinii TaxID=2856823 RepID=A0A8F6U113_9RHOB|nr:cobalamin biosynthesis protein [Gymnodinialimonas ceratoperidinii]QXT41402.1 cobalamin biosynthesis protein [Gymnodinialimonas ceratoperidinii]
MIVAGFGFRAAATVESLADAYARAGGGAGCLATAEDKAAAGAIRALATRLGLPLEGLPAETLAQQETATRSAASQAHRNTGSVAESAALAAAGPGARLLAARVVSADRMATCALARTGETP